jgi:hypothetical protein
MTRIQKIAEKMGWENDPLYLADGAHEFHILETWNEQITGNKLCVAHLLIERMMGDGWHVHVSFIKGDQVQASAFHGELRRKEFSNDDDFPAAVVELFCRVFDIKED